MIDTGRIYPPDPIRAAKTNCGSVEAFERLLAHSREHPDAFWGDLASELEWIRRWDTVREGEFPHFIYFAVVGSLDAIKGTVPAAFVTLKSGQTRSPELEQQIRQHVASTISKIAVPEHLIFTDVLPKTPSGKIMRRLLKEILASGDVRSDITALEDLSSVEKLTALVAGTMPTSRGVSAAGS
jgi:hypothetical protein